MTTNLTITPLHPPSVSRRLILPLAATAAAATTASAAAAIAAAAAAAMPLMGMPLVGMLTRVRLGLTSSLTSVDDAAAAAAWVGRRDAAVEPARRHLRGCEGGEGVKGDRLGVRALGFGASGSAFRGFGLGV